jgi:hypothetical protein
MATKNKKSETLEVSEVRVTHVKSIKNSLFKDLAIGESVKVGGIIRSLCDKEGSFGSYTEFKGDFACVHGDLVYRGTKLFLPSVAADPLKNQFLDVLESLPENTDRSAARIEFKISLEKSPDDSPKNAQKFQWVFENLQETAPQSDRVLALMS